MRTEDKLREKISQLQQQLDELEKPQDQLIEGQTYRTHLGKATVTGFYTEDELQKVRVKMHLWNPTTFEAQTSEPILMSTTLDNFKHWIKLHKTEVSARKKATRRERDVTA